MFSPLELIACLVEIRWSSGCTSGRAVGQALASTQRALKDLVKAQKVMANMIVFDENHKEVIFNVAADTLKVGDILLINSGETVPMDCKILSGEAEVNEAIVTGESIPVHRVMKDILLGGSTIENGTIKAYVTAVGDQTVLANILKMVKAAQGEKPPVQILADKISAILINPKQAPASLFTSFRATRFTARSIILASAYTPKTTAANVIINET